MMKFEFEKIAGIEVSEQDYNIIIEPMYMATVLSKEEFVKTLNLKRFALKSKKQLIISMKKLAKRIIENCVHFTDYEAFEEVENIMQELRERFDPFASIERGSGFGCNYIKYLLIGNDRIDLLN